VAKPLFRHTSSVKELGSCQNSQDRIVFLVKQETSLELSDIPVVRDILDVFLEASPFFSHDHVVKFMSKLVI
jgi:hypothetical protein